MDLSSDVALSSGNQMPVLGLGTWQLTDDTATTIMEALRLGYRMIDTSGDYGTQPGIGKGIKNSGVARNSFYLVTKVEETEDAYESTKNNLRQLGLDYADLMLIHRPPETGDGESLWQGLIKAKKEGLTKDIGVSNYSADQIKSLMDKSGETPAVNQIEWSPFGYSNAMLDFARENKIVIQAYSPLTRAKRLDHQTLEKVSKNYGKSPAQLLIRWSMQIGCVPLPKANQRHHLAENINVFDFEINQEDMAELNRLNEHYSALGSLPYV